jgi:hypothetical protein
VFRPLRSRDDDADGRRDDVQLAERARLLAPLLARAQARGWPALRVRSGGAIVTTQGREAAWRQDALRWSPQDILALSAALREA